MGEPGEGAGVIPVATASPWGWLSSLLLLLQAFPDYPTGDQCLFCHRNDIGPSWQKNPHNLTTRQVEGGEYRLGFGGRERRLRAAGYGRLELWQPAEQRWDPSRFAERCAGCHTTAVEPADARFAGVGLDCVTCHGVVDLNHSSDPARVLLSKKRRDETAVVNAICGQCHLRGGRSASTGRPYPKVFVPGRNLFTDYKVDLAAGDDAHVFRSVREGQWCLDCHAVHARSTARHRRAAPSVICNDCHYEGQPRSKVRQRAEHNATCEY